MAWGVREGVVPYKFAVAEIFKLTVRLQQSLTATDTNFLCRRAVFGSGTRSFFIPPLSGECPQCQTVPGQAVQSGWHD